MRTGDLFARKKLVKDALDKVKVLLEVTYPLGTEIYRDENGSVFVVPDVPDILHYTTRGQSLKMAIQEIANKEIAGEALFTLSLSDRTRDALLFCRVIAEVLPKPRPEFIWLKKEWKDQQQWQKGEDICPICGLRPQGPGPKAKRRKVCDICEERRNNRSEQWISNPETTIWIDEVADQHGQLALLVGRFDLDNWLADRAFNTMLSFDPQEHQLETNINFKLSDLAQDIQQGLNEPKHQFKKQSLLATLVPPNNRYGLNIVEFYNLRVKDTDLGSVSSTLNREKMLTLSLIRQPPSFARIRRTWETMRTFWEGVESDFEAAKVIVEVDERIQIQGKFTRNGSASELSKVSHTYELKIDGINVSVVCISSSGEFFTFITADNLQRVAPLLSAPKEAYINYKAAADYVVEKIEMSRKSNIAFEIQESAGYNHSNQILGTLQVSDAHLKQFKYTPAITILAEPRTFMAIVPADKAINVANAIKAKYEVEMGKVRNRLPLTLGIVFAGSRTPLPAILDAGRRMLGQPTKADLWEVVGKVNKKVDEGKPNSVIKEVELTLKSDKNGYKFSINVPTVMGDEKVEDAWYPYWCVEEDSSGNRPSGRQRQFESWNGKEWVHVLNLEVSEEKDDTDKKGDTVHFAPSRFDFEFLDTAARRFEISYEDNKRRGSVHPARPYYLEQLNDFTRLWGMLSNNLFTSQIHNLIEAIETKRLEWQAKSDNPTFENMIRMILKNADWKIPADYDHLVDIDYLVGAACSGQLADVFKLYVRILKKPSEVDKVEETNDNN